MSRESARQLVDMLVVRYGQLWFRMWDGVDPAAVSLDWERQLQDLTTVQLLHGVENLPPARVPTCSEFKVLCKGAPAVPALPEPRPPKADPARVAEVMSKLPELRAGRDPLQWARDLQAKELAGEFLTFALRDAWRAALGHEVVPNEPDDFRPIPPELMPPAMRPDAHTVAPDEGAST